MKKSIQNIITSVDNIKITLIPLEQVSFIKHFLQSHFFKKQSIYNRINIISSFWIFCLKIILNAISKKVLETSKHLLIVFGIK